MKRWVPYEAICLTNCKKVWSGNARAKEVKVDDEESESAEHEEKYHGEAEEDVDRVSDGEEHPGGTRRWRFVDKQNYQTKLYRLCSINIF